MKVIKRALLIVVLLAMAGAIVVQSKQLENRAQSERQRRGGLIYLPSPLQLKLLSLGFTTVAADYFWVQTLQYAGAPERAVENYKDLPDFIDLITDVDPNFRYAYKFGILMTPQKIQDGGWLNAERSTAIAERAVAQFPDDWNFHFYLGYNYLFFHDRKSDAAEQFRQAARSPKAPQYVGPLAIRVLAAEGDLDKAALFAEEIARTSPDEMVAETARRRIAMIGRERVLRDIEAKCRERKAQIGIRPSLTELGFDEQSSVLHGLTLGEDCVFEGVGIDRLQVHVPASGEGK